MSSNSKYSTEKVLSVHHWNDTLFSFKTTRQDGLRFENGQFVMIGLEVEGSLWLELIVSHLWLELIVSPAQIMMNIWNF